MPFCPALVGRQARTPKTSTIAVAFCSALPCRQGRRDKKSNIAVPFCPALLGWHTKTKNPSNFPAKAKRRVKGLGHRYGSTTAVPCCCFLSAATQEPLIKAAPFCPAVLGLVLKRGSLHVFLPRLLSASDHRARGACARVCLVFAVNDRSQGLALTTSVRDNGVETQVRACAREPL